MAYRAAACSPHAMQLIFNKFASIILLSVALHQPRPPMTERPELDARTNGSSACREPDADDSTGAPSAIPLCFVVDDDSSIRHFLSLILHGGGIDAEGFSDGTAMCRAAATRNPDRVIF